MVETIQISDPKIIRLNINVEKERVTVVWAKTTVTGIKVETGTFVFWKTIPSVEPVPPTWYELSPASLTSVVGVIQMAKNFIDANVS